MIIKEFIGWNSIELIVSYLSEIQQVKYLYVSKHFNKIIKDMIIPNEWQDVYELSIQHKYLQLTKSSYFNPAYIKYILHSFINKGKVRDKTIIELLVYKMEFKQKLKKYYYPIIKGIDIIIYKSFDNYLALLLSVIFDHKFLVEKILNSNYVIINNQYEFLNIIEKYNPPSKEMLNYIKE